MIVTVRPMSQELRHYGAMKKHILLHLIFLYLTVLE